MATQKTIEKFYQLLLIHDGKTCLMIAVNS